MADRRRTDREGEERDCRAGRTRLAADPARRRLAGHRCPHRRAARRKPCGCGPGIDGRRSESAGEGEPPAAALPLLASTGERVRAPFRSRPCAARSVSEALLRGSNSRRSHALDALLHDIASLCSPPACACQRSQLATGTADKAHASSTLRCSQRRCRSTHTGKNND